MSDPDERPLPTREMIEQEVSYLSKYFLGGKPETDKAKQVREIAEQALTDVLLANLEKSREKVGSISVEATMELPPSKEDCTKRVMRIGEEKINQSQRRLLPCEACGSENLYISITPERVKLTCNDCGQVRLSGVKNKEASYE